MQTRSPPFNSHLMAHPNDMPSIRKEERKEIFDPRRRTLLFWIPSVVCASIAATLFATAFRFLRPRAAVHNADNAAGNWMPLVNASSLSGDQPILKKLTVEKLNGWSLAREERDVFVLPGGRVVSAVCPHEQCEVAWSTQSREFQCPCHDSRFSPEGKVLSGPAVRDLDELSSRVENDLIQVRLDV
jgi:Rieske Fe-S protein